jgi:hypothetical protein
MHIHLKYRPLGIKDVHIRRISTLDAELKNSSLLNAPGDHPRCRRAGTWRSIRERSEYHSASEKQCLSRAVRELEGVISPLPMIESLVLSSGTVKFARDVDDEATDKERPIRSSVNTRPISNKFLYEVLIAYRALTEDEGAMSCRTGGKTREIEYRFLYPVSDVERSHQR